VVTQSVASPGDTHLSDATANYHCCYLRTGLVIIIIIIIIMGRKISERTGEPLEV